MADKPKYEIKAVCHPDDEGVEEPEEAQFQPVGDESIADVLKRTGTVALAARRIWESLNATTPQGWPDYRARAVAALGVRDTCDGKPIERQQIVKVTRTEAPPMDQLASTPAGIEAMVRMLAMVPGGREAMAQAAGS